MSAGARSLTVSHVAHELSHVANKVSHIASKLNHAANNICRCEIEHLESANSLPVKVESTGLRGGRIELSGKVSSL